MAVTVTHSTPADGTFSATGAAAWDADHNFTGTIDVTNGGTGAATLTSNALLKGNGTSAISASSITDNGTLVTIAEPVRLSTPNTSSAAWTTSGINLIQSAATFTDTSSTGTVAAVRMNNFAAQTLAASNVITATNLFGTYFTDPTAGTNVTATNRYALGVDSISVAGALVGSGAISWSATGSSTIALGSSTGTGIVQLGRSTLSQTVEVAQGTTASGSTKTVNIGTGGASGSTTNITVGSATSGATSSITANGQVTLAPIGGSRAAWTSNGVGLIQSAATWTDTSSTGTVGEVRMNNLAAQTIAASNVITVTSAFGTFLARPAAGTNVTISNAYALYAEGIYSTQASVFTSSLFANGVFQHTGGTGTQTTLLASATTASGSTKTVNIGTGGASGSTTAITLGSSTSGATQTTTINGRVTLAPIGASAAAWAGNGVALVQSAATWTDTTTAASGTVSAAYMNAFNAQTYAATNTAVTVSNAYGAYFAAPIAGTNVTITNRYGLTTEGLVVPAGFSSNFNGTINANGNVFLTTSATITLGSTTSTTAIQIGQSTASQAVNIHTGTTASGSTKTVNIGTGGASGSTTNIAIGSSTSGATSTTTLNGKTVFTGTAQLQGYTVATLPAGTQGMTAFVTDALAPAWNMTLVGGGAVVCKAFFNGTNWVAG